MTNLSGKTVLVTGASKGIGASASRYLAKMGANVVLAARSKDTVETIANDIQLAGGKAVGISCDVSDYTQVKSAIEQTVSEFGSLDVLVNNAGLIDPIARLEDSNPADWAKVIDVNVTGVYNCAHAALPIMKTKGEGVIINISSGAATSALEGWSHYCSSKAAAHSLTRCLHREEAENGIRVIGLSPGTVATDMQVAIKASGINPVSQLEWEDHIPPEWVARAIAWMISSDAKEFDGGDVSLRDAEIRQRIGLG